MKHILCLFLTISVAAASLPIQDIGGTLAFQGQDIVGGAAIIFKPPKRVRDLAGNTAALLAAKRPSRPNRPTEVARNNSAARPTAQPTPTIATTTAETRVEALKEQGNAHYDRGDYQQAIEAYQNALKLDPQDADVYTNLGAAHFNLNKFNDAVAAFQKAVALKS